MKNPSFLTLLEEGVLAVVGAVNELVDQHDIAGLDLRPQRADGADANDKLHAKALICWGGRGMRYSGQERPMQCSSASHLQAEDVGAVVHLRGVVRVALAVARQEGDLD